MVRTAAFSSIIVFFLFLRIHLFSSSRWIDGYSKPICVKRLIYNMPIDMNMSTDDYKSILMTCQNQMRKCFASICIIYFNDQLINSVKHVNAIFWLINHIACIHVCIDFQAEPFIVPIVFHFLLNCQQPLFLLLCFLISM